MPRLRIRTLKPELWEDEAIGKLGHSERLLFIGLITMADDDGRMRALPSSILGHVFPYEDIAPAKIRKWLQTVATVGLIQRYEHEGVEYVHIKSWESHQRINRKTDSTLPAPAMNGATARRALSVSGS